MSTTTPDHAYDPTDTIDVPLIDLAWLPFYTNRRGGRWMVLTPNDLARIEAKIEVRDDEEGCWIWTPPPTHNGYGQLAVQGDVFLVHHLLADLVHGRPSKGKVRGHLCHDRAVVAGTCEGGRRCRHRICVNPRHMTNSQTIRENIEAGVRDYGRRS